MFDRLLRNKIDDKNIPFLFLPPGSCNALFELCWIPWKIQIHHHAGVLKIKTDSARFRRQQDATFRLCLEALQFLATAFLLDVARVDSKADILFGQTLLEKFQHSDPLGEDNDLAGRFR